MVSTSGVVPGSRVSPANQTRESGAVNQAPSIGRAIDGVEIYILDEQRQPVSDGGAGEIYHRRRGTRPRVQQPPGSDGGAFCSESVQRGGGSAASTAPAIWPLAARTARSRFSGGLDEQVKVRGYRVEPSEVSTVLGQHPAIQGQRCGLDGRCARREATGGLSGVSRGLNRECQRAARISAAAHAGLHGAGGVRCHPEPARHRAGQSESRGAAQRERKPVIRRSLRGTANRWSKKSS